MGNQTAFTEQAEKDLPLALAHYDIIVWHFKYSIVYLEKPLAFISCLA